MHLGMRNLRAGLTLHTRRVTRAASCAALATGLMALGGCGGGARMLTAEMQHPIDRAFVTGPKDCTVVPYIRGLDGPTAIAWDTDGSILIAEGGNYDDEPQIIGFKSDGSRFTVYPYGRRMFVDIGKPRFTMYGPIGGMAVHNGLIYVSHRDENGFGVISALDRTGGHTTIAAKLNARGDYAITDLAIGMKDRPRLYFGLGSATNSGVVGIDNWSWVRENPEVHDLPWPRLHLLGYRFDSPNPFSGLFGPGDIAVTAPFQPFNVSNQTEVKASDTPNAAIYSCDLNGGDVRVEAHGIRNPVGLASDGSYTLYFTNQGMKLRGTRPIKNDRDSLLRLIGGAWYGWPDYTTDLQSVSNPQFQPPVTMIAPTGYSLILPIIDRDASSDNGAFKMISPTDTLSGYVVGKFSPLSGAAKMTFVPKSGPFHKQAGAQVIVALSGDEAPFDTSGHPFDSSGGYKVVEVDMDQHKVTDFVKNTGGGPGSRIDPKNQNLLERPFDPKFGPDGALYILDIGRLHMHGGRPVYEPGTGKIFRVIPQAAPTMFHD